MEIVRHQLLRLQFPLVIGQKIVAAIDFGTCNTKMAFAFKPLSDGGDAQVVGRLGERASSRYGPHYHPHRPHRGGSSVWLRSGGKVSYTSRSSSQDIMPVQTLQDGLASERGSLSVGLAH